MPTTLTLAERTYGWRSWREAVLEVLLGGGVGFLLTFTDDQTDARSFLRNALIVAAVVAAGRGLETMLSWALEQSNVPALFRALIYAAGGGVALFAVAGVRLDAIDAIVGGAVAAVTTGMVLHHNRKRNDRLRASIERLKEHEFAEKELQIARELQQRLLPPPVVSGDGFRVTARTHAAHLVGGDFYDVLRLEDDAVAIVAADVSGKGIAASLIMASCKAVIPFLAVHGDAAAVMNALNASLCDQLQRREFVAMLFVRLDPATGTADVVNAGLPDPLIIENGTARPLTFTGDRLPLGAMRTARYEATRITLTASQRLLLFTDGLPEASIGGAPLGYEKVEELAAAMTSVDALVAQVTSMATIEDDMTIVILECGSE